MGRFRSRILFEGDDLATINIGKCRSLADIEDMLLSIEKRQIGDKIVFPIDFFSARHSPIHDVSRLQMITTLARKYLKDDYIELSAQTKNKQAAIDKICSYALGIVGARLTKGMRFGLDEFSRRDVLSSAIEKMQATDAGDFDKIVQGRIIDLACVAGSKVQYLRPLFSSKGKVKEDLDMRETMRMLMGFVNKQSKNQIPDSIISALGLFTSELIQNTQEHAVTNHIGERYLEHVEGMLLGWTRLDEKLFLEDFIGNPSLEKYWRNEVTETDSGKLSLRASTVSYFDTGPGIVSRFTGKLVTDMDLAEERGFLLECLKNKTSSKTEDAAGEGLPSVLGELRKVGGLIRIRTGRLSIFNAFLPDSERDILDFENWDTCCKLSAVEGTIISILVPLRDK